MQPATPPDGPEIERLRSEVRDLRQALDAIRKGGVDAVVSGAPGQEQVYTLTSADRPYRLIIQQMNEGALTVSPRGVVLFANPHLARMLDHEQATLTGTALVELVRAEDAGPVANLVALRPGEQARVEVLLRGADRLVPAVLAATCIEVEDTTVVCIVATDQTAQKDAEARLERTVADRTAQLQGALAELEGVAAARLKWAQEVNDTIVQMLVGAETAADLGQVEESRQLLHAARRAVRERVAELLAQNGPIEPGSLVRGRSAEQAAANVQGARS